MSQKDSDSQGVVDGGGEAVNTTNVVPIKTPPEFILRDARQFMGFALAEYNIHVNGRGLITGTKASTSELILSVMYKHKDLVSNYNKGKPKEEHLLPFLKETVADAYEHYISEMKRLYLEFVQENLRCSGENLNVAREFLRAVCGEVEEHQLHVFAHWLWTVKRSLYDQPTVFELMIIFYGPQGKGKSVALRDRLLIPIEHLTIAPDLDKATSDKSFAGLAQAIVARFDELAGIKKADADKIKRIITETELTYRPMRLNGMVTVKNQCRWCGTSNRPLKELFSDSTGMRRFYEFKCLETINQDAVNAINYTELWRGIDESKDRGYLEEHMLQISKDQDDLVVPDEMEQFISAFNLTPVPGEGKKVLQKDIFKVYETFCVDGHFQVPSIIAFGRRFSRFYKVKKTMLRNKSTVLYYVLPEAACVEPSKEFKGEGKVEV